MADEQWQIGDRLPLALWVLRLLIQEGKVMADEQWQIHDSHSPFGDRLILALWVLRLLIQEGKLMPDEPWQIGDRLIVNYSPINGEA